MRVLIVDDEPLARARLQRLLSQLDGYNCVGEAANAEQAKLLIGSLQPDLLLLDIAMQGQDGIALAKELLQCPTPPAVIFVTAHPQHALDAYSAGPVDYLLKPVSAERLKDALQRAGATTRAHLERHQIEPKLSYTLAGVTRQLAIKDVMYFAAEDKYVRVYAKGAEALIEYSLTQLEQQFSQHLLRIHRRFLINKSYFAALHTNVEGNHCITLIDCDIKLQVSRRALPTIKSALKL
ncbi:MAG: LytTR family DNA-binding domain-containing protein [Gammaproteobacteria bacterium]|nr:LytTR family DNA-binding domain-containing protein [Gammaproteobacteria bacterium]